MGESRSSLCRMIAGEGERAWRESKPYLMFDHFSRNVSTELSPYHRIFPTTEKATEKAYYNV